MLYEGVRRARHKNGAASPNSASQVCVIWHGKFFLIDPDRDLMRSALHLRTALPTQARLPCSDCQLGSATFPFQEVSVSRRRLDPPRYGYFLITAPGLEGLLADEARERGYDNRNHSGGVTLSE
jgi:hypothetical protein